MTIKKETIIRTIVLLLALVNQVLVTFGKNPLPWSADELYAGISLVVTVAASLVCWWKNNSFTQNAIKADEYKAELKEGATDGNQDL